MPGRDGTGPIGAGSMTGRGTGVCSRGIERRSAKFAGERGCGMGRGAGSGRGMGLGRGFGAGSQLNLADEKIVLEKSVQVLEEELNARKKRIEEIG